MRIHTGLATLAAPLFLIAMGWTRPAPAEPQDTRNWRLARVYWRQNAENRWVRIVQSQADSRGGSIDLEHFPPDPGCREAAITARYRWRFDRDIAFLSGTRGSIAFTSFAESNADQGKGCWNVNARLEWTPGQSNDFASTTSFPDRGDASTLSLEGQRSMRVEVRYESYVRDGYVGAFIVVIRGHGIEGGWTREAVYEFERAVGDPPNSKETLCDQYAKAAVVQHEENVRRACGFQGVAWQSNYAAHYGWCLGADVTAIDTERRQRNEALESCSGASSFTNPMLRGYRVDRCLAWAEQCDKPAADRFCEEKGFSGASAWRWEYAGPTLLLGSGQICQGDKCGAFSYVECFNIKRKP